MTPDIDTSGLSKPPPRPAPPAGVSSLPLDAIGLALSGDGRHLAAGNLAGRAMLWDLSRNVFQWSELTPEGNRVRPVVFAPSGDRWLAGTFDAPDVPWRLYASDPPALLGSFGRERAVAVAAAFDTKGERFVTATELPDGTGEIAVRRFTAGAFEEVWSTSSEASAVTIDGVGGRVAWVAPKGDPQNKQLPEGSIVVVVGVDGVELARFEESERFDRVAFDEAAVVMSRATTIVRRALGPDAVRTTLTLSDERRPIRELTGRYAITRAPEDGLIVWSSRDGSLLAEVPMGCPCELHALSADGCVAACACSDATEVRWARVTKKGVSGCP